MCRWWREMWSVRRTVPTYLHERAIARGEVEAGAVPYSCSDVGSCSRGELRKARVGVVRVPATRGVGGGEGVGKGRIGDDW